MFRVQGLEFALKFCCKVRVGLGWVGLGWVGLSFNEPRCDPFDAAVTVTAISFNVAHVC